MRPEYPTELLCCAFEVSRSGFYAWLNGAPSPRAQEDAALKVAIQAVHRQSRETYGPCQRVLRHLAGELAVHVVRAWRDPHAFPEQVDAFYCAQAVVGEHEDFSERSP